MCWYVNAFVPASAAAPSPEGVVAASLDGPRHRAFSKRFSGKTGTLFTVSAGHCLCRWKDWASFYRLLRRMQEDSEATSVTFVRFFTADNRPLLEERRLELTAGEPPEPPQANRVYRASASPDAAISAAVGKAVSLRLRGRGTVQGIIDSFDEEGRFGSLRSNGRDVAFEAAQVVRVRPDNP